MGQKLGAGCAPLGEGDLGSHLTHNVARAKAYMHANCQVLSCLIHPTVWPQYTNVTDRTGQTDRQQSDSIGRTVLQTVAQNQWQQDRYH